VHDLDVRILRALTCGFDPTWGDVVAQALNDDVFGAFVFALLALLGLLSARARAQAPRAILAVVLCVGALHLVRMGCWKVVPRDRPGTAFKGHVLMGPFERATCERRPDAIVARAYPPTSPSFPSSHTITAGGIAAILAIVAPWPVGALAWLYALLVGTARVFWSKHWPSDIVGSLLLCVVVGRPRGGPRRIDARVRGPGAGWCAGLAPAPTLAR
jgi:membrane-associated phospholipid phosphatase